MATISYCISVCDEALELNKLLSQIVSSIDNEDEILILADESRVTSEVSQVINTYKGIYPSLKVIGAPLNKDFATFKNNFVEHATKEYLFQIDCDEQLSDSILLGEEPYGNLKYILDMNPEVDLFWIPRENYVAGITQEYVQQWRWGIDNKGRINYPDAQSRIFKNTKQIKWEKRVHEQIVGHKQFTQLPSNYYLIHNKTLEKQINQNLLYSTI